MPSLRSISSSTSTSVRPAGSEIRRRRSRSVSSGRLREPIGVVRRPALVAQRVIFRDRVPIGAGEPERHSARDAGAVAAAGTVDRRRRLRVAERGQCLRKRAAIAIGEPEIRLSHRRPLPRHGDVARIHRLPQHRNRQRLVVVGAVLALGPQIDDQRDAVVDERLTTGVAQAGQPVGPHDGAVRRLAAAGERQPAEVADVDATVPAEDAFRRRWCLRVRTGPRAGRRRRVAASRPRGSSCPRAQ